MNLKSYLLFIGIFAGTSASGRQLCGMLALDELVASPSQKVLSEVQGLAPDERVYVLSKHIIRQVNIVHNTIPGEFRREAYLTPDETKVDLTTEQYRALSSLGLTRYLRNFFL